MISVVIPARDSQETIRVTIETLFNQTERPDEVIVVVCPGDLTHTAIEDYISLGFVKLLCIEAPKDYVREAQWKRWIGIQASKGDVIFLTDSKVELETHALENATRIILERNVDVVGGITPAWPEQMNNFWARLHDKALVSNLPDFPSAGLLTKKNFGKTESLPVTSALMIKRKVFEAVSSDFALEFSKVASTYDDYVLSWLIVEAGFPILVTNQVVAHHKHRISWKGYSTQISRSGQSAALMAQMYPACPFGTRRTNQVTAISLTMVTSVVISALAISIFGPLAIGTGLVMLVLGYSTMGIANIAKAKELKAFVFPIFTIILILLFSWHFVKTYTKREHLPQEVVSYLQIH